VPYPFHFPTFGIRSPTGLEDRWIETSKKNALKMSVPVDQKWQHPLRSHIT